MLFYIGTTALGSVPVVSPTGDGISEGIHQYNGTITVTPVTGASVSYTGKKTRVMVDGNTARFTIYQLPLGVSAIRAELSDVTIETSDGTIPDQSTTGLVILGAALESHVYGHTLTDPACDLEFDVLNSDITKDFVRLRFIGTATN